MKSIYKKVDISYLFLIVILLSLISGLFKDIIILFMVIMIHEIGHILMSLYFKWDIKKISIGVCGGYIYYNEKIDKPFKEELLISISGFLIQIIFLFISYLLYIKNIIDIKDFYLIRKYNLSVIIFNLLPIIPLDGSKILNIFLNIFFSYKLSLKLLNIISLLSIMVVTIVFLIFDFKLECSYIMILSFLLKSIITSIKDAPFLFNKFLLQRYNFPINKKKYIYIKGNKLHKLRRQKKHIFLIDNKTYTEKQVLSKKFDYLSIL